jgi:hypothetical protein
MNISKIGGTLYRTNNDPAPSASASASASTSASTGHVAPAKINNTNTNHNTNEAKLNAGADFQRNSALLSTSDSVAKMLKQKRSKKQRQFLTIE